LYQPTVDVSICEIAFIAIYRDRKKTSRKEIRRQEARFPRVVNAFFYRQSKEIIMPTWNKFFRIILLCILPLGVFFSTSARANGQCPAIGYSSSCSAVITIQADGSLSIDYDPNVLPYDGDEDTLVGVINRSGATVFGIALSGPGIFAFDGDGANGGNYAGPGTSFTIQDSSHGTVNFPNGLNNNDFIWFSLEGAPTKIKLSARVTIDPGHGYNCAGLEGQKVGAVGVTNFPSSNPPPGYLHEDDLTVAIGNDLNDSLSMAGYEVSMTKSDVNSCPTLRERGEIANKARSNIFVSVHVNRALKVLSFPLDNGTYVFYNSAKTSSATLAQKVSDQVSSRLGTFNRGAVVSDVFAVLKPSVSRMTSILVENGRLAGGDELILHSYSAAPAAAAGIEAGIDAFLNQ
jgi:N-acetylmuramoyl-L-alanine amidase